MRDLLRRPEAVSDCGEEVVTLEDEVRMLVSGQLSESADSHPIPRFDIFGYGS